MDSQTNQVPTEPPVQTPPSSDPAMSFVKYLWISLALLLMLGVVGSTAYLLGRNQAKQVSTVQSSPIPTSGPTANWTIYQNSLGFSLKYPADKLVACDPTAQTQFNLWKAPFDCPNGHDILYEVGISIKQPNEYQPYGTLSKKETITVDGVNSTRSTYTYGPENGPLQDVGESTEIVVPYKNRLIIITLFGKDNGQKERFDQILSTFKFTSQTNLKTYTGKYLTFSYPSNWNPSERDLFGGAIYENINIGIPGINSDQDIGFSSVDPYKPNDAVSQTAVTMSGLQGTKYLRKGHNYVSYDYYVKTKYGTFSIHVTSGSEDKSLESQLDLLAQSVQFK